MKAKAIIKVQTTDGSYLLNEIHGLAEGTEIIGEYNEANGAVFFDWNGEQAVAWVGENCELVALQQIEYAVAEKNSIYEAEISENYFDDLAEAKEYKKENGGYLYYGASWINPQTLDYINAPEWGKTLKSALAKI